jgi:iron complex transport system ATP-binding protein
MPPLLSADGVSVSFGATRVLEGVTLTIEPGGMVGILGPNGSGKTTLQRVLAGALRPDAGRVRLDGVDVSALPRQALARRLAVVPQETELAFDYSVIEIVLMGRYPHLGAFEVEGPEDLAAAHRALVATGTEALAERSFRTLSGGEKQRVVIASALAQLDAAHPAPSTQHPASLLFLDEPTASLDLRYQLETASLLRRLHDGSGVTILLSTHDLHFARSVCTTIVLLSRGTILASGSPADVLTARSVAELYGIDPELAAPLVMR